MVRLWIIPWLETGHGLGIQKPKNKVVEGWMNSGMEML